jgi:hypothetical protein
MVYLFSGDQLYFHRSWTGSCIYLLKFMYSEKHVHIAQSWLCGDAYNNDATGLGISHEELLKMLIESFLLNRYE